MFVATNTNQAIPDTNMTGGKMPANTLTRAISSKRRLPVRA